MRNRTADVSLSAGDTEASLPTPSPRTADANINAAIDRATTALLEQQRDDGHWCYPIEESGGIATAEYLLLHHYLGEKPHVDIEQKMARYLRRLQLESGGWAKHSEGVIDIGTSVKNYLALRLSGDAIDAGHMVRAAKAIRQHGGAEASNVITRLVLAQFGVAPWRAVPTMPVEIMLLPSWFPFHLSKISSWARAVIVPLLVLSTQKATAKIPQPLPLDELFNRPPAAMGLPARAPHQGRVGCAIFNAVDGVLRWSRPFFPKALRQRATDKAVAFVEERLNDESGFAGIYLAITYTIMMYDALGYPAEHPKRAMARQALEKMLIVGTDEAYCQATVSPVWDTAFMAHALLETGNPHARKATETGLNWLLSRQILDVQGDWAAQRPDLPPGGWAFQYQNPYYPDIDDTAVVIMALQRGLAPGSSDADQEAIRRATAWLIGLQSRNGGWGAFDVDNTWSYLNNIPFSDHGALLDPPTADVSSRSLSLLGQLGKTPDSCPVVRQALNYLWREQEADGSWFGRWGINYLYGTWSALCALNAVGIAHDDLRIRRAVQWLLSRQNADGGWGESPDSYDKGHDRQQKALSTSSQSAWAMLGLMAVGEVRHPAVARGAAYLMRTQRLSGEWEDRGFTGTVAPSFFYLRYHGYSRYFPLWALARYRRMLCDNVERVSHGL